MTIQRRILAMFAAVLGAGIVLAPGDASAAVILTYTETVDTILVKGDCTQAPAIPCFIGGPTVLPPFTTPAPAVSDGTLRIEAHADLDSTAGSVPNRESLEVVIDGILTFPEVFRFGGNSFAAGPSGPIDLPIPLATLNTMVADGTVDMVVTAAENIDWPVDAVFTIKATLAYDYSYSAPAATPEPGTLLLIGSGLVGLGVGARRRSRTK